MKINQKLADIIGPAYAPCPGFSGPCRGMCWNPERGHVPRGFYGATGKLSEVKLVLVFAEPGDPQQGERHTGVDSAIEFASIGYREGKDLFYKNVRRILDICFPDRIFEEQMRQVWMTESVLCSARRECGYVPAAIWRECQHRYLWAQIAQFPSALVVALGAKAKGRLQAGGFKKFICARTPAPPGGYRNDAVSSWQEIRQQMLIE